MTFGAAKGVLLRCLHPYESRSHSSQCHILCSGTDTLDLEKTVHTGYILAYSPHRKASFAILK